MPLDPREVRELDFSQFHPLDHWPGTARCRSMHGGIRNHLRMAWDYRWEPELRTHTTCRIGRHRWVIAWSQRRGEFRTCVHCHTLP